MRTECLVDYELYDTTALDDAEESSSSNSDFANIELIKSNVAAPSYMTLEHNFSVLDGGMQEFPDEPEDLVYFSSGQAVAGNNEEITWNTLKSEYIWDSLIDAKYTWGYLQNGGLHEEGTFTDEQSITIDFTENHTSIGLTLYFLDNYPQEIEIYWYDLFGTQKAAKTFYPDSLIVFCENQVEEYGKLKIAFKKALPYHNVKLQYIEYGTTLTWGKERIKTAQIVNYNDPTSDKIQTDTLTFEIIDENDDFNIGNLNGLHKSFQKKQRMIPYEIVDGAKMTLGAFFLDSNSTTKNLSKISAIDYKGMLANTNFMDGRIYEGEYAGDIIDEIMEAAGISDYEVDDETANTLLYGTLKIQTCQKALREVLFACGSTINTSRITGIKICKSGREVSEKIPRSKKFSTTLQTDHYVSDVNVKYKTWALSSDVTQITKGRYDVGTHTIQLTNPAANMVASTGTIVKQMPYYLILELTEDDDTSAEVVISGQKYNGEELAVLSSIEHIKSGEVRNTKTFTGTLLNFESAKRVADYILDYYQLQQIIQTKHLSENEKAGDWVEIENTVSSHGNFVAGIESLTLDLAGGFIGTAQCRGYYKLTTYDYYAGSEIYAGEEAGII